MAKKFSFILFFLSILILTACIILHRCRIVFAPEKSPLYFWGICAIVITVLQVLQLISLFTFKAKASFIVLNLLTIVLSCTFALFLMVQPGTVTSAQLNCENRAFCITKYRNGPFDSIAITTPCQSFCSKIIVSQNVEAMEKPIEELMTVSVESERNVYIFTYTGSNKNFTWEISIDDLLLLKSNKSTR